jgi:hypothetical protein
VDTAGRYTVAALLVALATIEFLCRILLVILACCTIVGLMVLMDEGKDIAEILEPASLGLIKGLVVVPAGQLTTKQQRELAYLEAKQQNELAYLEKRRVVLADIRQLEAETQTGPSPF